MSASMDDFRVSPPRFNSVSSRGYHVDYLSRLEMEGFED